MKQLFIYIALCSLTLFCSCDYFLDLDPVDEVTEEVFYDNAEDFEENANYLYRSLISWRTSSFTLSFMDFGSDLTAMPQAYGQGGVAIPTTDVYWNNSYTYIRDCNLLLAKAQEYTGDASEIAEYVAAAKFFRAYSYYFLMERFGGVPIIEDVMDLDSKELTAKRNSRYEVFNFILEDLNVAIPDLPLESEIALADKGHLSTFAAQAFKAKALLYEATWERYVAQTTDGDGVSAGAGSEGYDAANVDLYLAEAVSLSKNIIENGGYTLWNYNSELSDNSSYYLFCLEDELSNPGGLSKVSNNEFILYSKYDFELYKGGISLSHTVWERLAPSRKMMDLFLCDDGLPVDASTRFQGYQSTSDEYQNRDNRLISYFGVPDTEVAPADGSVTLKSSPGTTASASGYYCRKFRSYNYGVYRQDEEESSDYAQIRLAEVYLIYAEALYELNGAISDADLAVSINQTRARAGLPGLTNTFVTNNGLDMLTEIRRERAVELFGENSRFNDLKRWGIAETELNQTVFGSVIEGTDYEDNTALYLPSVYPHGEAKVSTGSGELNAIVLDPAANRNFARKHYLYPLPADQILANRNLIQNVDY